MLMDAPSPTGADPIPASGKSRGRRLRALVLVGAVVLALVAVISYSGLGYATPGEQVAVPGLEQELSRVLHEQLLSQGFDYEPSVACDPTDASHFSCAVTIHAPDGKTLAETIAVSCASPSVTTGHRCSTDTGYALQ
jgi:hypothetical protein